MGSEFKIFEWNYETYIFIYFKIFAYRCLKMIIDYTQEIFIMNDLLTKVFIRAMLIVN